VVMGRSRRKHLGKKGKEESVVLSGAVGCPSPSGLGNSFTLASFVRKG
jgi:hypothetical protein